MTRPWRQVAGKLSGEKAKPFQGGGIERRPLAISSYSSNHKPHMTHSAYAR